MTAIGWLLFGWGALAVWAGFSNVSIICELSVAATGDTSKDCAYHG